VKEVVSDLTKIKGVLGAIIIAKDGVLIDKDLAVDVDDEVISAMVSAVGNTISRASELMHTGNLKQAMIDAQGGKIFIADADFGYIAIITIPEVNIGLIRLELKKAAEKAIAKMGEEEAPQKTSSEPDEEKLV